MNATVEQINRAWNLTAEIAGFVREGEEHNGMPYEYTYEDSCEVINSLIDAARDILGIALAKEGTT